MPKKRLCKSTALGCCKGACPFRHRNAKRPLPLCFLKRCSERLCGVGIAMPKTMCTQSCFNRIFKAQRCIAQVTGETILRGVLLCWTIANAGAFKMLPPLFRRFSVTAQPGLYLQTKGN